MCHRLHQKLSSLRQMFIDFLIFFSCMSFGAQERRVHYWKVRRIIYSNVVDTRKGNAQVQTQVIKQI